MKSQQLRHARRGMCMAIAVGLLGPLAAVAQPSSSVGTNSTAGLVASDATGAAAANPDQGQQSQSAPGGTTATNLGAIVVTANKRKERLQDVPMAVSATSGYQLERQSAFSFADYATQIPGLNVISTGAGQTQLVLRGITSGSGQANASVGTYIDDTPYGSSTVYSAGSVLSPLSRRSLAFTAASSERSRTVSGPVIQVVALT